MANYQHEPAGAPGKWQGEERRFALRVEKLFDEVFAKLGLHRTKIEALSVAYTGATEDEDGTAGLVPAPKAEDREKFLRGDGTWQPVSAYEDFTGATSTTDGAHGLVPAPAAGSSYRYLSSDGSWRGLCDTEILPTGTTPGMMTLTSLFDYVYPVGSIYMSMSSTSPETLFGGTWAQIEDTFLLAAGTTYAAGATGGEATHTLTVDEMPSHTHNITFQSGKIGGGSTYRRPLTNASDSEMAVTATGGDQPHNNMPPYLAVYVWRRTA